MKLAGMFALLAASFLYGAEPNTTARTVVYNPNEVVPILVEIRYATLLEFPQSENIVQYFCGDCGDTGTPGYVTIDWQANTISIKAAKVGESTNLNVLTVSGRSYSFLVKEVSQDAAAHFDLKVFVKVPDLDKKETEHPKYIPASAVAAKEERIQSLEAQLKEVSSHTRQTVEQAAVETISTIKHPYEWDRKKGAELGLKSIYTDGKFTYVEVDTQSLPALSELIGGKEATLQYSNAHGLYTINKVLDAGVLRSGKIRVEFKKGA